MAKNKLKGAKHEQAWLETKLKKADGERDSLKEKVKKMMDGALKMGRDLQKVEEERDVARQELEAAQAEVERLKEEKVGIEAHRAADMKKAVDDYKDANVKDMAKHAFIDAINEMISKGWVNMEKFIEDESKRQEAAKVREAQATEGWHEGETSDLEDQEEPAEEEREAAVKEPRKKSKARKKKKKKDKAAAEGVEASTEDGDGDSENGEMQAGGSTDEGGEDWADEDVKE